MNILDVLTPVAGLAESIVNTLGAYFKSDADKEAMKKEVALALQSTANVQAMITLAEVQSEDKFKSRWRPALGWVCVVGLGAHYVIFPLLTYVFAFFGLNVPPPTIDAAGLTALVASLLGLGAMRSVEKVMGSS